MGCMLSPAKGSMSVLRWWTAWMCLYSARMWMNLVVLDQIPVIDIPRGGHMVEIDVDRFWIRVPVVAICGNSVW